MAYQQADRLRRLIEQLLDLSRLDGKAITVAPRPIVLRSVLGEIVKTAAPKGLPLELDVPADLAAVADPLVLERVVSNLLANAVRHGAPPIHISAEQRDRHLRVSVEDAGTGVPEELRARLFERFARGDAGRGSGLGLAIARAYAQAHGGDLVYHEQPRGARFELVVPQEQQA
jgi:signal transduction histidine kinase